MAKTFVEGIDTREKALAHLRENAPDIVKKHEITDDSPDVHVTTAAQYAGYLYEWRNALFRQFEVILPGEPPPYRTLTDVPGVDSVEKALEHLQSISGAGFVSYRDSANRKCAVGIPGLKKELDTLNDQQQRQVIDAVATEMGYIYSNYRPA